MNQVHTHYDNLKVARNAPPEVIRAAYKALSQKHHPDRNPGDSEAARIMTIINSSYDVLSDPAKRREHDLWILQQEVEAEKAPNENNQPSPNAKTTTAQPTPVSNINTRVIAAHVFKYGVLYAIGVLIFVGLVTNEPSKPPVGPKPYQATPAPLVNDIFDASNGERQPNRPSTAPNGQPWPTPALPWSEVLKNPEFLALNDGQKEEARQEYFDDVIAPQVRPEEVNSARAEFDADTKRVAPVRLEHVRPSTAPNGQPWPASSAYIKGYKRLHTDGLSTVTVDNTRNDSDVFVKLVTLDGRQAYPVRQFFISAFGKFTLNKVRAGSYDIRYRDLTTGGLSRSEAFTLNEKPTYNGAQFSNMTMTLYKVQNGNMQTYGLSEAEF